MIRFEEVIEDNYNAVIKLNVSDSQKKYVAANVRSLADCYVDRNNNDVFPYAIFNEDIIIGFVLFYTDDELNELTIWRIMIDEKHQSKGYGSKSLKSIIKYLQCDTKYEKLYIDYVIGNDAAKSLYTKLGFQEEKSKRI